MSIPTDEVHLNGVNHDCVPIFWKSPWEVLAILRGRARRAAPASWRALQWRSSWLRGELFNDDPRGFVAKSSMAIFVASWQALWWRSTMAISTMANFMMASSSIANRIWRPSSSWSISLSLLYSTVSTAGARGMSVSFCATADFVLWWRESLLDSPDYHTAHHTDGFL